MLHRAYLDLYNFRCALMLALCLALGKEQMLMTAVVRRTQKECYTTDVAQPSLPLLFYYLREPWPFQPEQQSRALSTHCRRDLMLFHRRRGR